jgi:hypothetical protein
MNIKKSRIIQIIKEEVSNLREADSVVPPNLDAVSSLKLRAQEHLRVAMEHITDKELIEFAAEELQRLRQKINPPTSPSSIQSSDKTDVREFPPEALKIYQQKMGIKK